MTLKKKNRYGVGIILKVAVVSCILFVNKFVTSVGHLNIVHSNIREVVSISR